MPRVSPNGVLIAAIVIAVGSTACSGSEQTHSFAQIEQCIRDAATDVRDQDNMDPIIEDAGQGGIEAQLGRNFVQIAVERNVSDAEDTAEEIEFFGTDERLIDYGLGPPPASAV